jgi:periplasmic divalent cation tolerance protein
MKDACDVFVVFVSAPDAETARTLVRAALEARLIACANILTGVESHYWWQEKIESAGEVFAILKTTKECLEPLEKLIAEKHPYDTPEFLAVPVQSGSQKYLAWLEKNVGNPKARLSIS